MMKGPRARWGLVLIPLLIQLPLLAGVAEAPPTAPVTYPVALPAGYYEYFPIDAYANTTVVQYSTSSNVSITTAFMTLAQLQDFNSSNGPVSNSLAYRNGSYVSNAIGVGPGSYDVLVFAYGGAANVTLQISVSPYNPYAYGRPLTPEPTGLVSFGLTNESGRVNPYSVYSDDVVGLASIGGLSALNSSADSLGVHPTGVTLQLNSMLVVGEGKGVGQVYWCQNTPDFVTSASQVSLSDNVWNASSSGVLTNASITSEGGGGSVNTLKESGATLYFYAVALSNSTYTLPLGVALLMNATLEPGTGVLVRFGAQMTGGVLGTQSTDWFDNVTIHDAGAESAYFVTDGNYSTPNGQFYDTELVFGGEGNGEETYFTNMTASLGLYYANGTTPWLNPFPSYYSFGLDTKEAADNLRVTYLGNGEGSVATGSSRYVYLGSASGNTSAGSAEASLGFPRSVATTTTTSATSTAAVSSTTSGGSASTSSQGSTSTSPVGVPEFPFQAAGAAAVVALAAAYHLVARRRQAR